MQKVVIEEECFNRSKIVIPVLLPLFMFVLGNWMTCLNMYSSIAVFLF